MKHILIATDGSAGGGEAVAQGLELAAGAKARATMLYVRGTPSPVVGEPYYQRALDLAVERGRDVVAAAAEHANRLGIEADGEILEGDAAEAIVRLARLRDVDLIVVGSRALGPLRALLGSVSRSVVHHADRPVLVVPRRIREGRAAA